MVIGLPPHHQVSLPLAVNGKRGLHPEAMLKKMHELVAGPEKKNSIYIPITAHLLR